MGITKVTRNYQVTLPKDVREIENIKVGDTLAVTIKDEGILMKKLKRNAVKKAFGSWGTSKESGVEYVRKIRDESEKRLKRLGL